jgi:hypothetical protein
VSFQAVQVACRIAEGSPLAVPARESRRKPGPRRKRVRRAHIIPIELASGQVTRADRLTVDGLDD